VWVDPNLTLTLNTGVGHSVNPNLSYFADETHRTVRDAKRAENFRVNLSYFADETHLIVRDVKRAESFRANP